MKRTKLGLGLRKAIVGYIMSLSDSEAEELWEELDGTPNHYADPWHLSGLDAERRDLRRAIAEQRQDRAEMVGP